MKTALFYVAALALLAVAARAAPAEDRVHAMPGLDKMPPYAVYSGYVQPTEAHHLQYTFLKANKKDSMAAPLVLWLPGGPGCSALLSLAEETGPFRVQPDGRSVHLAQDESWNNHANMLYLEAPACVGFSWSAADDCDKMSDHQTAAENYAALNLWLEKFPEFEGHDFYIAAESYGGFYGPWLSELVVKDADRKVNFKGLMLINGVTDFELDFPSVPFMASHSLISFELTESIYDTCGGDLHNDDKACQDAQAGAYTAMGPVNMYNILAPCLGLDSRPTVPKQALELNPMLGAVANDPPCFDSSNLRKYFNAPAFAKAFHVNHTIQWDICNAVVNENFQIDQPNVYDKYMTLIDAQIPILHMSGDMDLAVPSLGTQACMMNLNLTTSADWAMWSIDGSKQVAGYRQEWQDGLLSFATVKGAGHAVPQDASAQAMQLFKDFIAAE